jgi:TPR repeat protein
MRNYSKDSSILVKEAMDYIELGRKDEAKKALEQAAEMKNADAMNRIGEMYLRGIFECSTDKNEIALEWFRKAMELAADDYYYDYEDAKSNYLYVMYSKRYSDESIPYFVREILDSTIDTVSEGLLNMDYWPSWVDRSVCEEIADYYREKGYYEDFLFWAGKAYEESHDLRYLVRIAKTVERSDIRRCMRIFQEIHKEADLNDSYAMELCGDCYRIGYGVPQSDSIANYWYNKCDSDLANTYRNMKQFEYYKLKRNTDRYYKICGFEKRVNNGYYPKSIISSKMVAADEKIYLLDEKYLYVWSTKGERLGTINVNAQAMYFDGKYIFLSYFENAGETTSISVFSVEKDQVVDNFQLEEKCIILDSQKATLLCLQYSDDIASKLITYDVDTNDKKIVNEFKYGEKEDLLEKGAFINDKYIYFRTDRMESEDGVEASSHCGGLKIFERKTERILDVSKKIKVNGVISWIDGKNNYAWIRQSCETINNECIGKGGESGDEWHEYYEAWKISDDDNNHLIWYLQKHSDGMEEHFMENKTYICNGEYAVAVADSKILIASIWGDYDEICVDGLECLEQISIDSNCIYVYLNKDNKKIIEKYEIGCNFKINFLKRLFV